MADEIEYKEIPDYPGYRVGTDGSIWSRRRKGGRNGRNVDFFVVFNQEWTKLNPSKKKDGYIRVTLSDVHGKRREWLIHQLILITFVGPRPKGMQACYYPNPDKADCRLSNLRWGTRYQNAADALALGRYKRGENHPKAAIDSNGIRIIRVLRAEGWTYKRLADLMECHHSTIENICRGWTRCEE